MTRLLAVLLLVGCGGGGTAPAQTTVPRNVAPPDPPAPTEVAPPAPQGPTVDGMVVKIDTVQGEVIVTIDVGLDRGISHHSRAYFTDGHGKRLSTECVVIRVDKQTLVCRTHSSQLPSVHVAVEMGSDETP